MTRRTFILALLFLIEVTAYAQPDEFYISLKYSDWGELDSLSQIVSIDKVDDGTVWAYASAKELNLLERRCKRYQLCSDNDAAEKASYTMAHTTNQMREWTHYPTYDVYEAMMAEFAAEHPDICKLEEIATLASGHRLLSVKISGNVLSDSTDKPELLCTANIHGNECVCMVTALRLCDYLLSNYDSMPEVRRLIDSTELWILPLANPDGMYRYYDDTIKSSTRSNGHSVDLNRNYPHINGTQHPDGNDWQEETTAMMRFFDKHHFSLSVALHNGSECFNYPWDTWKRLTADDDWWRLVGSAYRDTAQAYSASGYFDDGCNHSANGLTNGYAWYSISGGQQDYANYYKQCREVTVEISSTKILSGSSLPKIWEHNRRSLVGYLSEGLNGVRGKVCTVTGEPLSAQITIEGHDADNSWVETDSRAGDYHRYLKGGRYSFTFSANGYVTRTIDSVDVTDGRSTWLDVELQPVCTLALSTHLLQLSTSAVSSTLQLTIANSGINAATIDIATDTTGGD